jgi:phage repressor protein C with HTH and peptisase S24 domain
VLGHGDIWRAVDRLAERHGLTPSALARLAGLDATAFNKSKRFGGDGRARWPSTESLAKILAVTGESLAGFAALCSDDGALPLRPSPVIGYAQAGAAGYFDDAGYPAGRGWDSLTFPDLGDANAYALEISGDSMLPVYRDGDIIVLSPAAALRRGDRVVVKTLEGEVMAKELARLSATRVELASLNPAHPDRAFERGALAWMARIVWASQ